MNWQETLSILQAVSSPAVPACLVGTAGSPMAKLEMPPLSLEAVCSGAQTDPGPNPGLPGAGWVSWEGHLISLSLPNPHNHRKDPLWMHIRGAGWMVAPK